MEISSDTLWRFTLEQGATLASKDRRSIRRWIGKIAQLRLRPWRVPLSIVFALACYPGGAAQAEDQALARAVNGVTFDQFVQSTLRAYGVPGAVVVVSDANGVVFLKGYGVRHLGASAPVDENTRFQLASMSKFIAATAVGTLVDKGVVSWDGPVRAFSPETVLAEPYATANASLRDYFSHRTGLPAYTGDLLNQLGYGTDDLVRRARYLPFESSFRARWGYSNYGIFLGQEAAAHAAGWSPPELLSRAIFEPLGMTRSGPTHAELFKDDNRASGHDLDGSVMPYENVDAFSGAGAAVSTGADFARFMRMLLAKGAFGSRRVLTEATVNQIFAASMVQGVGGPLQDPNDSAGLGCESYHFLRYRVIEKNGALNGFRTIVTLIPERNIGIAVLANKQLTVFPEAVRAEFLERELGPSGRDLQTQTREEQAGWASLVALPRAPTGAAPLDRDLDAFTGHYASDLYGQLTVVRDGGALSVTFGPNAYAGHLSHWDGNTFLLAFDNPDVARGLLTFSFDGSARASGIEGSTAPNAFSISYGHFQRAPQAP